MTTQTQPSRGRAVKADPETILLLADHLLNMADERWPGNLWEHLDRLSVLPVWINRLLEAVAPFTNKREVLQHALQMSWSEDRDFHIPEYFEALPKITKMVGRVTR